MKKMYFALTIIVFFVASKSYGICYEYRTSNMYVSIKFSVDTITNVVGGGFMIDIKKYSRALLFTGIKNGDDISLNFIGDPDLNKGMKVSSTLKLMKIKERQECWFSFYKSKGSKTEAILYTATLCKDQ